MKKKILFLFIILTSFILGSVLQKSSLFPIADKINQAFEKHGLRHFKKIILYKIFKNNDKKNISIIETNYYKFKIKSFDRPSTKKYGGIDFINKNLVYVNSEGEGWIKKNDKFIKTLNEKIPNNKEEFVKNYGELYSRLFGVKDILITENNNEIFLLASSTFYNIKNDCYSLSLFSKKINKSFLSEGKWKIIFNSVPCLKRHKNQIFAGTSAGGRIVENDKKIFLSIGDFYFDGVNDIDITSLKGSLYGKIIKIDPNKNNYISIVAKGLRNPQGLVSADDGLYETEHGPKGGDELNFIKIANEIIDYGWPNANFGVNYNTYSWPLDKKNNNHFLEKYQSPVATWIPAIAPSNLIQIKSEKKLVRWNNDLLIASLKAKSLFRVKLENSKVILIETIPLNFRMRDIIINNDMIYILEDGAPLIWLLEKTN